MLKTRRVPEELLDVITYELINDPVIAEDNMTYSRANILDWFSQCKARNEPITSPMTRGEMGETIRPNYPTQRSLELFQSQSAEGAVVNNDEAPSIAQLAKVFEVIDPIRDLLASIKWQPPAIVVLGNEKSGKSSLLERLAMIPIFPKAKQICTRMAIHVRLRRGPARPPLVEVYDKVAGAVLRDMVIPMEKGNEYVNDAMERILMAENDGVIRGICNRKMLVLHVSSPTAPNLDLVDLPGLVSTFVRGEPENMQALTRELVENYIKENSTHSMYLVTVPARSATNQSLAMEVVQRYKLQSRTIGVLTKSDLYATIADDDIERAENVRELCEKVYQRSSDVCPLPTYGYVATMNKPIREGQYATNYGALMHQAEREKQWFVDMGFKEIVDSGHATMGALVNRLSSVYHNYMRHTWAPLTILRLERERVSISQREQALGLPRADGFASAGQEKNDEGMVPRQTIATMATELTIQLFKSQRTVIIDRICSLILKNFQAAIRSESISKNCSPADAIDLQRQAKLQIESHCTSALDYLQKFMINEMKVILGSDKTSFCLHRFTNLIDAIMERSVVSLDQWRQDTENTMMNYVAMAFQNLPINPYLTVKYSFEGSQPMVKLSFDSTSLSDVLPHVMVLRLSALITDLLGSTVASVADNLADSAWIESCASERKAMLKTVRMIETAEAELMQVLFISPADMESFIGGGKDALAVADSVPSAVMSSSTIPMPQSSYSGVSSQLNSYPQSPYQSRLQNQSRPVTVAATVGSNDSVESTSSYDKAQLSARLVSSSSLSLPPPPPSQPVGISSSSSTSGADEPPKGYTPTKSVSDKAEANWTGTPGASSAAYSSQYNMSSMSPQPPVSSAVASTPTPTSQTPSDQTGVQSFGSSTPTMERKPYEPSNSTPSIASSYSAMSTPGSQRFTNPTPNNTPMIADSSAQSMSMSRFPPYQAGDPSPYLSSSSSPYHVPASVTSLSTASAPQPSGNTSSSAPSAQSAFDSSNPPQKLPPVSSPMTRMSIDRGSASGLEGTTSLSALSTTSVQPPSSNGISASPSMAPPTTSPNYGSSYSAPTGSVSGASAGPVPGPSQVLSSSLNKSSRFEPSGAVSGSGSAYDSSSGRFDNSQAIDPSTRSFGSYLPSSVAAAANGVGSMSLGMQGRPYGSSAPGQTPSYAPLPPSARTDVGNWDPPQGVPAVQSWASSSAGAVPWSSSTGANGSIYGSVSGQSIATPGRPLPPGAPATATTPGTRSWTQLAE